MSYPTQEEELQAKEAQADEYKRATERQFLSICKSIDLKQSSRLPELSERVVRTFDSVMSETRREPFARQQDIMVGLERLFREQINVIESRRLWAKKLNPETAETNTQS